MTAPEPRCTCCDLPVSSCGKAAEQRQRAALRTATPTHPGVTRQAIYPGTCADCGERVRPGDTIAPSGDGWKGECCL